MLSCLYSCTGGWVNLACLVEVVSHTAAKNHPSSQGNSPHNDDGKNKQLFISKDLDQKHVCLVLVQIVSYCMVFQIYCFATHIRKGKGVSSVTPPDPSSKSNTPISIPKWAEWHMTLGLPMVGNFSDKTV